MILRFAPPERIWSANERLHWSARNALTQIWRKAAWAEGNNARRGGYRAPQTAAIGVQLPVRGSRRRDPHNFTGTVVKAIVDGLVDAGFWPDDTAEHVTIVDPMLLPGGKEVLVVIEPRRVRRVADMLGC